MWYDPKGFELFVLVIAGLAVWTFCEVAVWLRLIGGQNATREYMEKWSHYWNRRKSDDRSD